jgi:tRNA 2-selenouridine synthase
MAIRKVTVPEFLELSLQLPVLDVRSPGEYLHAHIPCALSLPLFTDEERKQVGTAYKQVSREAAIKIGLDYFGTKMRKMVEEVEGIQNPKSKIQNFASQEKSSKSIIVHCWRGGMRSGAVAWLMDLYGFEVYLLVGGYKAFRRWALLQFEKEYNFQLIGGYTGSGKTLVLQELKKQNEPILDLEALAKHKGSAFGGLDMKPQPSTEHFENLLALNLFLLTKEKAQENIWVEDESQRIGLVNLPPLLWQQMRKKPLFFLDIPFQERLNYLVEEYGVYSKEQLINATVRIQKRLGGLETKTAINALLENDIHGCFEVLLKYYDKHYLKGLHNRNDHESLTQNINLPTVDAAHAAAILNHKNHQQHV